MCEFVVMGMGLRVTVRVLVVVVVFGNMWLIFWVKETRCTQLWLKLGVKVGMCSLAVAKHQRADAHYQKARNRPPQITDRGYLHRSHLQEQHVLTNGQAGCCAE